MLAGKAVVASAIVITPFPPNCLDLQLRLLMFVTAVAVPTAASAQFGHPLDGQWSGDWGPRDKPNRLLLNLDWDGKAISGVINPGPTAATIRKVSIDYADPAAWVVKMEADGWTYNSWNGTWTSPSGETVDHIPLDYDGGDGDEYDGEYDEEERGGRSGRGGGGGDDRWGAGQLPSWGR